MTRRRDESGAVALMFGLLALVLMGVAALGVDFASQVNQRQKLQDAMDAGAQAGAFPLPTDGTKSKVDALSFARAADATATPDVDYFCVVASMKSGALWVLDASQIPSVCNPASAKVGSTYTGLKCGPTICSIPCKPASGDQCNTIRLVDEKDVPFTFARALGIAKGGTGATQSVACKGSCGTVPPNPMDVAVVADRTTSMTSTDVTAMVNGIKGMLKVMTPSQQYVSLGTIGRSSSSAPSSCKTSPSTSLTSGPWMPTAFTNGYLNAAGTDLNTSNQLVKDISCLGFSNTGTSLSAPFKGAARYLLGSAVGASNNLSSLPARNTGTPQKVLIFETDGQPNENAATGGSASLSTSSDLFSNTDDYSTSTATTGPVAVPVTVTTTSGYGAAQITINTTTTYNTTTVTTTNTYNGGQNACNNLKLLAANAKAAGILVVTIAFNIAGKACDDYNPTPPAPTSTTSDGPITVLSNVLVGKVRTIQQRVNRTVNKLVWSAPSGANVSSVLADVASPTSTGAPSTNNSDCGTTAGRTAENTDGDYFFCAASGTDMAPIFKTALSQAGSGIKLIRLP
ncbi:TadE/TadG family type IV pilus assembly protein [Marmoricola sp. OAE513]|uniref:TadE/TadG family type IV pilus assembly protein n=1 Tax=Marmoricola sp. OAE513 TaxID=2817894 RepID=UPI001AE75957